MQTYKSYIKVIGLPEPLAYDEVLHLEHMEHEDIELNITYDKIYMAGHNTYKLQRVFDNIENYLKVRLELSSTAESNHIKYYSM